MGVSLRTFGRTPVVNKFVSVASYTQWFCPLGQSNHSEPKQPLKEAYMFTQTDTTFVVVSQKAQDVINVSRRHHWSFRLITDFHGVIDSPVYNAAGDWLYMPMRDEDRAIIPKAAFKRHHEVIKAGIRVAQVVIGHEIRVAPEQTKEPI